MSHEETARRLAERIAEIYGRLLMVETRGVERLLVEALEAAEAAEREACASGIEHLMRHSDNPETQRVLGIAAGYIRKRGEG